MIERSNARTNARSPSQNDKYSKGGPSSRHPDRLHVVGPLGQDFLVAAVRRVHRVDLSPASSPTLVDDLLSVLGPGGMGVGSLGRELDGRAGRDVHHADVEVPLVAAGERDSIAARGPGDFVVPVTGVCQAPSIGALG